MRFNLARAAKKVVDECLLVKAGEKVLIASDDAQDPELYLALVSAATQAGAEVALILFPTPEGGIPGERIHVPWAVLAAEKDADVFLWCGYRIPAFDVYALLDNHISHARSIMMPGLTVESFIRVMDIDIQAVALKTAELNDVFKHAKSIHVTCPLGTDVTIDIHGCGDTSMCAAGNWGPRDSRLGPFHHGELLEFLPAGRIGTWVPIGRIDGVLYFQDFLGLGLTHGCIKMVIKEGIVTSIDGIGADGWYVSKIRELFSEDENSNIAIEIGIGTNPSARLVGTYEDYGVEGVVRFGFGGVGHNGKLSVFHSDSFTLGATMEIDGKYLIKNGEMDTKEILGH